MLTRVLDLRQKEVINVIDGKRLGFVYDVEMDLEAGKIDSLVVPGDGKLLGVFGKNADYIIPWNNIKKIGKDIILVEVSESSMKYITKKED